MRLQGTQVSCDLMWVSFEIFQKRSQKRPERPYEYRGHRSLLNLIWVSIYMKRTLHIQEIYIQQNRQVHPTFPVRARPSPRVAVYVKGDQHIYTQKETHSIYIKRTLYMEENRPVQPTFAVRARPSPRFAVYMKGDQHIYIHKKRPTPYT